MRMASAEITVALIWHNGASACTLDGFAQDITEHGLGIFSQPKRFFFLAAERLGKNPGIFYQPLGRLGIFPIQAVFNISRKGIFCIRGIFYHPKRYFLPSAGSLRWPAYPQGFFHNRNGIFHQPRGKPGVSIRGGRVALVFFTARWAR